MRYPVNEIFQTLQGEATFTGTPSVFVRLQGCDVGCPWCDTKHTWSTSDLLATSVHAMLDKQSDGETFAYMAVDVLVAHLLGAFTARHIVITGGEPCVHDLRPLTSALIDAGCAVQVETSGTEPILVAPETWVTVSPKIGMPGGKQVRLDAIERANEIKHPVGKAIDVERLQDLLVAAPRHPPIVWLQPLSQSQKATGVCIDEATENGWRVSLQTHKFAGVR